MAVQSGPVIYVKCPVPVVRGRPPVRTAVGTLLRLSGVSVRVEHADHSRDTLTHPFGPHTIRRSIIAFLEVFGPALHAARSPGPRSIRTRPDPRSPGRRKRRSRGRDDRKTHRG